MEGKPKRERKLTYNSIRALPQNRDLPEEEFQAKFNTMLMEKEWDKTTKEKFESILKDFEVAYDLSEMLPNDRIVLNNMIQAMISLDNYENYLRNLMRGDIQSNLQVFEKINSVCKDLRSDISKMQDDLNITRKRRKNEKEASVINFIEDLKEKARKFYQQKMQYIFCEKCNTLLATVWWLYPESKFEKITVRCERKLEGDKMCGWTHTFTAKELLEMGGRNKEDIPDSMK
jgi:RNase P subunit RPR2